MEPQHTLLIWLKYDLKIISQTSGAKKSSQAIPRSQSYWESWSILKESITTMVNATIIEVLTLQVKTAWEDIDPKILEGL